MPIANAIRSIKSESSRWMHETCGVQEFAWQEGYVAISIGHSQETATLADISSQPEHHRRHDFQAEFVAILKRHNIDYDPRYVWG